MHVSFKNSLVYFQNKNFSTAVANFIIEYVEQEAAEHQKAIKNYPALWFICRSRVKAQIGFDIRQ